MIAWLRMSRECRGVRAVGCRDSRECRQCAGGGEECEGAGNRGSCVNCVNRVNRVSCVNRVNRVSRVNRVNRVSCVNRVNRVNRKKPICGGLCFRRKCGTCKMCSRFLQKDTRAPRVQIPDLACIMA